MPAVPRGLWPGSLTDIAGLQVGHAGVAGRATGCTVVLSPQGVVAGVAVRGGAPGTRETDLLRPENTVQQVHAVLLTGGSAFGLDAAAGVMRWLEARGHGLLVGPAQRDDGLPAVRVPIVPAAVLFDLWHGDWRRRPDAATGLAACESATAAPVPQGRVGAGLGATVGKLFGFAHASPGGLGSACLQVGAVRVAALVAVNAIGDVVEDDGTVIAGSRAAAAVHAAEGSPGAGALTALLKGQGPTHLMAGMATTIGVVATDARLDKAQATQLASLSHHGLARAVQPITPHDGDTVFALATGASGRAGDPSMLGAMAAEVFARAIRNAVKAAAAADAGGS